jgi:hypothetical protein
VICRRRVLWGIYSTPPLIGTSWTIKCNLWRGKLSNLFLWLWLSIEDKFLLYSKSKRALGNYKLDSVIGVIKRNDEDQQRRLKYLPASVKELDTKRSSFSTSQTLHSMMLESSSSTATGSSSYKSTDSSKISTAHKAINHTLPKGQKTIKGN